FTDHNDVRVLPQKRLECRCKGQTDVRLNVHLVDAHEIELDGVFRSGDIDVRSVQSLESGIQCRRLAASCRTGHQQHAIRRSQRGVQIRGLLFVEAQLVLVDLNVGFVQETQASLLPEQRRQDGDTKINIALGPQLQLDAAILWQPP